MNSLSLAELLNFPYLVFRKLGTVSPIVSSFCRFPEFDSIYNLILIGIIALEAQQRDCENNH